MEGATIKELISGISAPQKRTPQNFSKKKGIKVMKKLFGILMALVLALALLPTTVFAAEEVAKIDDGTTYATL